MFLCVELFVRIAYSLKSQNINWLIAPFTYNAPVIYEIEVDNITDETGNVLYFKHKPGVHINKVRYGAKEYTIRYSINKDGFRNCEISRLKNKYRVVCFGGSSTLGLESSDNETWPAYLEQFLPEENVEVINMGVSAYDSYHIFNLLSMEAYKYRPDLALLYFGRNDLHHNLGKLVLNKWHKRVFYRIHKLLYYKVMTYTLLLEKISVLKQNHADPFLFYPYDPFPEFLKNFRKILNFCEINKIKVVYICQVKNYNGDPQYCIDLINQISNNVNFVKAHKPDSRENYIINLFKLHEIVKEVCAKYKNVYFIDPRLEFYGAMLKDNTRDFFSNNNMDTIHLTPLGNKVLAEIISRKIRLR